MTVVFIVAAAMALAAVPVAQAQAPIAAAMFVRASVENETPYLGQQIAYTFRIYQRSDAALTSVQVRYNPPGFTGFWNSQETQQDEYTEAIDSNEYRVVELRTLLFPSVVGAVDIAPAVLEVSAGTPGIPGRLESSAVSMEVSPLPAGAPAAFTGAVGRFDISASADSTEGKVNEPVRLTVNISGEGNIEALPDPAWPEFAGWRVIESPVSSDSHVVAGQVTGSRTYEITLVPEKARGLTIPEIRYPHFDPLSEQYVQTATPIIAVAVAGAAGSPPVPQLPAVEAADQQGPEMRPLKKVPPSLRQPGMGPANSVVYWAAWGIPALAIAGAVAWRRRRTAQEAARAETQRRSALPDARAVLARAVASGEDPGVAAANAMLSYVSARLEIQLSGLTREALLRRLGEAGVLPELRERVNDCLTEGESARYTPPAGGPAGAAGHADHALQLMGELEEAISA